MGARCTFLVPPPPPPPPWYGPPQYYIRVFSRIFCSKIGSFHRIPQPRNRKNGSKWLQVSMILAWHAVGASGGWQSSRRPCNIAPYPSKEKHTKNKKFEAAFSFFGFSFGGEEGDFTIKTRSWILDEGFLGHKKEHFSSSRLGALTLGCSHWPTSLSKYEKCNHFFLQRASWPYYNIIACTTFNRMKETSINTVG